MKAKYRTKEEQLAYGRDRLRKCVFGVPYGWYDKKFAEQRGCCAICGTPANKFKRNLHIDHDHETGQVRDLLCQHCNLTLGMVNEDKAILDKLKNYIDYWENQPKPEKQKELFSLTPD